MAGDIFIIGYGSLIWDLDDLAPKVAGSWKIGAGPPLPLEFSRISPKRKGSLVVVIDRRGTPCPTHIIASNRGKVTEARDDLMLRERTGQEFIGSVDMATGHAQSRNPRVIEGVTCWCREQGAAGAVWTDLDANFEDFSIGRGIAYLKTLEGGSLAAAEEYINCAPAATDTPLRRALSNDPWWQQLSASAGR